MDAGQLYREDIFTDHKIGTIHQLIPVKSDGSPDPSRAVIFTGQTQILTAGGMLPLSFEIAAGTLTEAVEKFGATAKVALEEMVRELQALRREPHRSSSSPSRGPRHRSSVRAGCRSAAV